MRLLTRRKNRYYYAVAECDTADTAAHIYSELEGTELERSANVFDMSFVPDDMTFDQEFRYVLRFFYTSAKVDPVRRDEASEEINAPFKPLDFTTDVSCIIYFNTVSQSHHTGPTTLKSQTNMGPRRP